MHRSDDGGVAPRCARSRRLGATWKLGGAKYSEGMRLIELDRRSEPYWDELIAGEHEPFGSIGEQLVWRDKTRNIGVSEDDGRLVAAAGVILADVKVGREPPFQVAGLGGSDRDPQREGTWPGASARGTPARDRGRARGRASDAVLPTGADVALRAVRIRHDRVPRVGGPARGTSRDADAGDVERARQQRRLASRQSRSAGRAVLSRRSSRTHRIDLPHPTGSNRETLSVRSRAWWRRRVRSAGTVGPMRVKTIPKNWPRKSA